MADRTVNIRLDTQANTQGANQAKGAVQGLKNEVDQLQAELMQAKIGSDEFTQAAIRLGQAQQRITQQQVTVAGNYRRLGPIIQGTSFQLQDFVTQVGMGTSALQSFGQQAPQLFSLFGPTGAIAGLIAGVGALGLNAVLKAKQAGEDATTTATDTSEAIKAAAQSAIEALEKEDEAFLKRIEDSANAAKSLLDNYKEVAKAQQETAKVNEDAQQKVLQFQYDLAEALGVQVDEMQKIEDFRRLDQQRAEAAAARQIQQAAQEANDAIAKAEMLKQQAQASEDILAKNRREMDRLQESALQQRLEMAAMIRATVPEFTNVQTPMGPMRTEVNPEGRRIAEERLAQAEAGMRAALERTQARMVELEKVINTQQDATGEIQRAALEAADKAMAQQEVLRSSIAQVQQTLDVDTTAAEMKAVVDKQTQASDLIKQAIEGIQPQSELQAKALATLRQSIADNQITADETATVSQAIQALGVQLNQNFQALGTTVKKVLDDMKVMNRQILQLQQRSGEVIQR